MFWVFLILIWSICLIINWYYTQTTDTYDTDFLQQDEQCHKQATTQRITEPIVIFVIIASNILLLLLNAINTHSINKRRHSQQPTQSTQANGLINDKYARIWMLCYGFVVCMSLLVIDTTIFQAIYGLNVAGLEKICHSKEIMTAVLIGFNLLSLCLFIVMISVQFSLLSTPGAYKLYRFCGRFIIFFVIVYFIASVIVVLLDDSKNLLTYVIFYIIGYDLWYIAADILDCDGMYVTSTRIYTWI